MKTSKDPRHIKRIHIMQDLFVWDFNKNQKPKTMECAEIIKNLPKIDKEIEKTAQEWPLKQINKIDLAILRLAIFELLISPQLNHCSDTSRYDIIKSEVLFRVIVDEAVELAKKYGSQSSPGFVNGVLGKLITAHKLDRSKK